MKKQYSLVPETFRHFDVMGIATHGTLKAKLPMLLCPKPKSKIAFVLLDAFRCSSTLLACFAAGIKGAVIMEKGLADRGVPKYVAEALAASLGCSVVYGGEMSGQPMENGRLGNSPREAMNAIELRGNLLHFQSANFGKVYHDLNSVIRSQHLSADVFVIGFPNSKRTADFIKLGGYSHVVVVTGGFFDCLSIEDMTLGGAFISDLGLPQAKLDDDALAMVACSSVYLKNPTLLTSGWAGHVLTCLSKQDDMNDIIYGRFPAPFIAQMMKLVLRSDRLNDADIIMPLDENSLAI